VRSRLFEGLETTCWLVINHEEEQRELVTQAVVQVGKVTVQSASSRVHLRLPSPLVASSFAIVSIMQEQETAKL
jgi:hypothetical protein